MSRILFLSFILAGLCIAAGEETAELVLPVVWTPSPIVIDGKGTEAAWQDAIQGSGFRRIGRQRLAYPQSAIRTLYNKESLFLLVECLEPKVAEVAATQSKRDQVDMSQDCIELFLDPWHKHTNFIRLAVNASGSRLDSLGSDLATDYEWRAVAVKGADRWTVEMAVNLRSVRIIPKDGSVWGMNLVRHRKTDLPLSTPSTWADAQGNFQSPGDFGHLWFVKSLNEKSIPRGMLDQWKTGRVFMGSGYGGWDADSPIKFTSYQELLSKALEAVRGTFEDAKSKIARLEGSGPEMVSLRALLTEFSAAIQDAEQLAQQRTLSALDWAKSTQELLRLSKEIGQYHWYYRLRKLLGT